MPRVRGLTTLAFVVVASVFPGAQQGTALAGRWAADQPTVPGSLPNFIQIEIAASQVTMRINKGPLETYSLTGVETTLPDGRTAVAAMDQQGVLTVTRTRTRSREDGTYLTIMRETHRVSSEKLIIERTLSGRRPGDTDVRWIPIASVEYVREP